LTQDTKQLTMSSNSEKYKQGLDYVYNWH